MDDLNKQIIDQFELLIEQIKHDIDVAPTRKDSLRHSFRLKQIKNALDVIKKYPKKIESGKQLTGYAGIGKGTITRIDEILSTGKLKEISIKKKHKDVEKYIDELEQVFGIGRKKAYELVTKYGIKSIADLKKAHMAGKIELTDQMMISLKHHNNYKQSIPRSEMDQVNILIQKLIPEVDPKLEGRICGSYRREKPTSNDIDILITHPDIITKKQLLNSKSNYLRLFVQKLKDEKFILDDLTHENYETKYMGYCRLRLDYPTRRIDIYYIPYESYYAALLHLTGSGNFNRKMRLLAGNLGYKLNEYGLFKIKNGKMARVKVNSEKDIFDELGMDYIEPKDR